MTCADGGDAVILPEEPVPPEEQHCEHCELFRHGTRMVWGEGNPRAPIMMILDNPGAREDREGKAFVCGTRQTLQAGMKEAGLPIDSVYITYLLKRRPIRAYNKPAVRESCFSHLRRQMEEKQPQLLFGFGNVVSEALFLDLESATVKHLRGSWHEYRETPIRFSYHPLAVRRRPNLWKLFVEDLSALAARWQRVTMCRGSLQ